MPGHETCTFMSGLFLLGEKVFAPAILITSAKIRTKVSTSYLPMLLQGAKAIFVLEQAPHRDSATKTQRAELAINVATSPYASHPRQGLHRVSTPRGVCRN